MPDHTGEWRTFAEWNWIRLGNGDRLHAVGTLTNDADAEWFGEGLTACGRRGEMHIPGPFSRMGAIRCEVCCRLTGMPQGAKSPKNVQACRPVVEARVAALEAAS